MIPRSAERGNAAVEELEKEGCSVKFHQLDIDDAASIEKGGGGGNDLVNFI